MQAIYKKLEFDRVWNINDILNDTSIIFHDFIRPPALIPLTKQYLEYNLPDYELDVALAAGYLVFLTIKFILDGVTASVKGIAGMIKGLDNRVQTMNNDLVKIDSLMSVALGVRPNVDRIAANEGKDDARKD